ncbi:MAG: ABC transporter ATP-binding protein [Clostridiales bacterium]|nr:ABC transporter ATP-binding protein [Clostridiales bacterium]
MIRNYIWRYRWRYLLGIITLFIVDFFGLYIPEFTGRVTDGLDQGTMDYRGVLHIIGLIFFVAGIMMVGRFFWRFFIFGSARNIEYELRNDMFEHLSKLSMKYYNEHKTGDLMAHFTSDLNSIRMAVGPAVISSFDAIIMTIMVIIKMILYVNLKLTLIACIPMIVILLGGVYYGKIIEQRFTEKQKAFSDMTDQVQESISGIRVIKAFVQEQKEIMAFAIANRNNKDKNLRVVKVQAVALPLLDLMIGISSALAILYGGKLVLEGGITPGKFVAFNQYILMLVWPMLAAGDSITLISQGLASMKRVEAIFNEVPEIMDTETMDTSLNSIRGNIQFNHLTFTYKQEGSMEKMLPVLKDVSVEVKAGSTLAVVGATGSGKTTLVNLLLRMYDTKPGMILIDGHDIKEYPLSVLRENIAYVPQDNFLFSDTIQTNIAFGVRKLKDIPYETKRYSLFPTKKELEEASMEHEFSRRENIVDQAYGDLEQVQEAAKKACIHDNIMEFTKQYATMVGERGVTVSGGQKQRSSIARALMKDAPILILDDALSAVDTNTEEAILRNLKENRQGKTTIMIAHRISTIQNADHILVLEDGRCVEYGTHRELLDMNGHYAKLYKKQQLEKQLEDEQ